MEYSIELIENWESQYGLPLYVFCEDEFISNFNNFINCFQSSYINYKLAYSYKTNYTPYICKLVKSNGGYAEVVSDMEYQLAKKIGYENPMIIYNGPNKGELAKEHILSGGILNADSLQEVCEICMLAKKNSKKKLKIGLRINIDVGQPFVSRFGIDADSNEFEDALKLINETHNLVLEGIHCHISQARGAFSWKKRTELMLEIADKIFSDPPKYIDLGSGMYGKMTDSLYEQFSNVSTYEEYAQNTACIINKHYFNVPNKPILFTEPGTTIINKYVEFIAKVIAIKNIKGKTFVVVNGSAHNVGEICKLKKLPIKVLNKKTCTRKLINADIVGYTCLEHDCIFEGFTGDISVGDYIIFENVGGYSNVSKPPFINPNCAMIKSGNSGNMLIKRKETAEDIFSTYII